MANTTRGDIAGVIKRWRRAERSIREVKSERGVRTGGDCEVSVVVPGGG